MSAASDLDPHRLTRIPTSSTSEADISGYLVASQSTYGDSNQDHDCNRHPDDNQHISDMVEGAGQDGAGSSGAARGEEGKPINLREIMLDLKGGGSKTGADGARGDGPRLMGSRERVGGDHSSQSMFSDRKRLFRRNGLEEWTSFRPAPLDPVTKDVNMKDPVQEREGSEDLPLVQIDEEGDEDKPVVLGEKTEDNTKGTIDDIETVTATVNTIATPIAAIAAAAGQPINLIDAIHAAVAVAVPAAIKAPPIHPRTSDPATCHLTSLTDQQRTTSLTLFTDLGNPTHPSGLKALKRAGMPWTADKAEMRKECEAWTTLRKELVGSKVFEDFMWGLGDVIHVGRRVWEDEQEKKNLAKAEKDTDDALAGLVGAGVGGGRAAMLQARRKKRSALAATSPKPSGTTHTSPGKIKKHKKGPKTGSTSNTHAPSSRGPPDITRFPLAGVRR